MALNSTPLEVAAAVFIREDKVLACRKKTGLPNAGLWEFPGGKRNAGESLEAALVREIAEELCVQVEVAELHRGVLGHHLHDSGSVLIELHCFAVFEWRGEFVLSDHDQLRWCAVDELKTIGLSAADVPFVDRIAACIANT